MTIKLKLSIIWFFAFLVYLGNLWFELRDFWRIDLWKTAFCDIFCQKLDFTRAAPLVLFIDKFWYLFSLLYLPNMDRWEEGVRRQIDDDGIEIRLKSWLCSREEQAGKEGRRQENKQSARSTHLPSSRLDGSLTWGLITTQIGPVFLSRSEASQLAQYSSWPRQVGSQAPKSGFHPTGTALDFFTTLHPPLWIHMHRRRPCFPWLFLRGLNIFLGAKFLLSITFFSLYKFSSLVNIFSGEAHDTSNRSYS